MKLALIECKETVIMNTQVETFTKGNLYPCLVYKTKIYAINNLNQPHLLFNTEIKGDNADWFNERFDYVKIGKID